MELTKNSCRKIAAGVFLITTLLTTHYLKTLNFSNLLAFTGGLFTGVITSGLWTETSYRFLVKEATAPLDKIVEKI